MTIIDTLSTKEVHIILIAVALLGLFSIGFGNLFKVLKLPTVMGEIFGGIVLGPSILGYFFPDLYAHIFLNIQGESKLLYLFYWIGLILLMFVSGYETKLELKGESKKLVIVLLIGSSLIPFLIGYGISGFFINSFIGVVGDIQVFKILFAIGVAVTSIPVISKIFIDLKIINTRFAAIVLSSATIEDLLEWLVLSISLGLAGNNRDLINIIILFSITIIFVSSSLILLPKIISKIRLFNNQSIPFIFCITYIAIMTYLDVNIIYSALIGGIVLNKSGNKNFVKPMKSIKYISISFFTPIYFAIVGLRIDILNNFNILRFLVFFLLAYAIQSFGIIFTLKFINLKKEAVLNFAIAMNARGGPGIVLASIGYEYGIINIEFFTVLVLTSVISSLIAGVWLRLQSKKGKQVFQDLFLTEGECVIAKNNREENIYEHGKTNNIL